MEHVEQERQLWIGGETRALELFEVRIRKEAAVRKHPSLEKPPPPSLQPVPPVPTPLAPPSHKMPPNQSPPFFFGFIFKTVLIKTFLHSNNSGVIASMIFFLL